MVFHLSPCYWFLVQVQSESILWFIVLHICYVCFMTKSAVCHVRCFVCTAVHGLQMRYSADTHYRGLETELLSSHYFLTGFQLPDPHISDREVLTSSTTIENSTMSPYEPQRLTLLLGTCTKWIIISSLRIFHYIIMALLTLTTTIAIMSFFWN